MGSYHAKLSPSSAERWTSCTASVNAQEGIPNESSEASRDGTMCHQMSEEVLRDGTDPQSYLGREYLFWYHAESESHGECWGDQSAFLESDSAEITARIEVTQEHVDAVVSGTEFVLEVYRLHGGELMAEQQVPIGHFTGEEGARGTTDVLILTDTTLRILDFKYGRMKVDAYEVLMPEHDDIITQERVPEKVRANLQMASYALGALEKYGLFYNWTHVTMTIIQPFINHISEYTCTIAELLEVQAFLRHQAEQTRVNPQYVPSPSNCFFCRASGNCQAQTKMVVDLALEGFEDVEDAKPAPVKVHQLGDLYAVIPLVQKWCKSVAEYAYNQLLQGMPVIRNDGLSYKLVEGKMGDREWIDPERAEESMHSMRLGKEVIYEQKLISPTKAEKLAKVKRAKKGTEPTPPVIGPTQWNRLTALIKQDKGKPTIALETDPKPAISMDDGFEDVEIEDEDNLF